MSRRDGVTELYELTPVEILSNIAYCTFIIYQLRTYYLRSVMSCISVVLCFSITFDSKDMCNTQTTILQG
jgi:hypothetical protein